MADKDIKKNESTTTDGIEEISATLTSFSGKVEKNKKLIMGIVGGVIIVVLGCFGWYFWRKHANKESAAGYSTELVKSQKSAVEKVQKEGLSPDSAQIVLDNTLIKNLEAFVKAQDGESGANLANIKLATLYYNQGKVKEALAAIEKVDIDEPVMKMQALIFKGDCYVDLNKYNEAIEAFNKVYDETKENNPEIAARALIKKAGVLSAQNKHGEALAAYELILKDYPQIASEFSTPSPITDPQSGMQMGVMPGYDIEAYAERERALAGK